MSVVFQDRGRNNEKENNIEERYILIGLYIRLEKRKYIHEKSSAALHNEEMFYNAIYRFSPMLLSSP
jgi:hypothetical protein